MFRQSARGLQLPSYMVPSLESLQDSEELSISSHVLAEGKCTGIGAFRLRGCGAMEELQSQPLLRLRHNLLGRILEGVW